MEQYPVLPVHCVLLEHGQAVRLQCVLHALQENFPLPLGRWPLLHVLRVPLEPFLLHLELQPVQPVYLRPTPAHQVL